MDVFFFLPMFVGTLWFLILGKWVFNNKMFLIFLNFYFQLLHPPILCISLLFYFTQILVLKILILLIIYGFFFNIILFYHFFIMINSNIWSINRVYALSVLNRIYNKCVSDLLFNFNQNDMFIYIVMQNFNLFSQIK